MLNLFSIKFLYFFIISFLFSYFNLFVSIFIRVSILSLSLIFPLDFEIVLFYAFLYIISLLVEISFFLILTCSCWGGGVAFYRLSFNVCLLYTSLESSHFLVKCNELKSLNKIVVCSVNGKTQVILILS
jgi:signal transduction histidine kinase